MKTPVLSIAKHHEIHQNDEFSEFLSPLRRATAEELCSELYASQPGEVVGGHAHSISASEEQEAASCTRQSRVRLEVMPTRYPSLRIRRQRVVRVKAR